MGTAKRVPAAPDIPTFVEQGLPGYVVEAWFAVIGPKGMSAAEVKRVHDAVVAAFADPAVKEAMAKQGNVINVSTSDFAQGLLPDRARQVRGHRQEGGRRAAIGCPKGIRAFRTPRPIRFKLAGKDAIDPLPTLGGAES